MATNYPASLDVFTNPTSSNTLDSPSHSLQHSDLNDAVEAIETKLGVGTATPGTATAYYPLVAGTAGATSWTPLTATGITSGSATNGQVLAADGSGGVSFTTASGGKVVQIVYASTSTETSSSSSTFVDTTLTATITPTSASNKVLVMVTHPANQKDTNNTSMAMKLMRGATEIAKMMGDGGKTGAAGRLDFGGTSINYLDSPATTSATTYKTQFMSQGGNASVSVQTSNGVAGIVLMEVTP